MHLLHALLFGIIEGVTEFLPISSTGHLTITEKLLGYNIDDPGITAFTAVIQLGATLATLIYFRKDIWRLIRAWLDGVFNGKRNTSDYRLAWGVIIGSVPIAIVGLVFKDFIETGLRSLWYVALALLIWSAVMYIAEEVSKQERAEKATTWRDALFIGLMQCLALIPGVSRSGATISAGLFRGFDRVAATRLSFFLAIPALVAAGLLEAVTKASDIGASVGWSATLIATAVTFVVAYASIAWLLKYIATHSFRLFIYYRIGLAALLIFLLSNGLLAAT